MIVFGINSQNRRWMMRPDQMFLSWSFGFLLLSTIASFISASFLCCVSYTDRAAQREVEHYEAIEGQLGGRSLAGGGTYLSGRIGPSTLFTRSVYASQPHVGGGVVLNVPSLGNAPAQTVEIGSNNFYSGNGPIGSQLTPLQEESLVDNTGAFSDQASGMYAHHSMVRSQYLGINTSTHSLLYGYRRGQEQ
nr:conserved hypothetical protein [Hymenolepis microstoma]